VKVYIIGSSFFCLNAEAEINNQLIRLYYYSIFPGMFLSHTLQKYLKGFILFITLSELAA
jgi:hypothetical protein